MTRSRGSKLEKGVLSETDIDFENEEVLKNMRPEGYNIFLTIESFLKENKAVTYVAGGASTIALLITFKKSRQYFGRSLRAIYGLTKKDK